MKHRQSFQPRRKLRNNLNAPTEPRSSGGLAARLNSQEEDRPSRYSSILSGVVRCISTRLSRGLATVHWVTRLQQPGLAESLAKPTALQSPQAVGEEVFHSYLSSCSVSLCFYPKKKKLSVGFYVSSNPTLNTKLFRSSNID